MRNWIIGVLIMALVVGCKSTDTQNAAPRAAQAVQAAQAGHRPAASRRPASAAPPPAAASPRR